MQEIRRLRRAAGRLRRKIEAHALVLLYHRVVTLPSDPYLLCVTPAHFAEHLEVLRRDYRPIPLHHLTAGQTDGRLPRRSVIITFDDGYTDSLHNAKPSLVRYDIPATVFVTAGHVGHEQEFWWDELEGLLLQPGRLPDNLRLPINGTVREWMLGTTSGGGEESNQRDRAWNIEDEDDQDPRHRLFRDLYYLLFSMTSGEQRRVLDDLRGWAAASASCRPTHRSLDDRELAGLAAGGLVEVGAHTVTHPLLSALPLSAQWEEINASKTILEKFVGYPVASFSYPFGLLSTYSTDTIAAVRRAGFACACSNYEGVVWRTTDRFQLPRFVVRDWDGDTFARQLEQWFRG